LKMWQKLLLSFPLLQTINVIGNTDDKQISSTDNNKRATSSITSAKQETEEAFGNFLFRGLNGHIIREKFPVKEDTT